MTAWRARQVACVNVATGVYLDFWMRLLPDLDRLFFPEDNLVIHLFTDRASEASKCRPRRASLVVHETPAYRWPEATLFRYELISSIAGVLEDSDVVVYLDVDTQIVDEVGSELRPETWPSELALVPHPMFYRPQGPIGWAKRLSHPRQLAADLAHKIIHRQGLGTWEEDRSSTAFVSPKDRRTYVMGAFWLGSGSAVVEMCDELARKVRLDHGRGYVAIWHDESHLNAYSASRDVHLLSPAYLYVPGVWQLKGLNPRLICIDKGKHQLHEVRSG